MAVYYPLEKERDLLLAHAHLLQDSANASPTRTTPTEEGSAVSSTACSLSFTESELARLATTCETIVSAVRRVTHYFTLEPEREDLESITSASAHVVQGSVIDTDTTTTTSNTTTLITSGGGGGVVAGSVLPTLTPEETAEGQTLHPFLRGGSVAELLLPRRGRPPLPYYVAHTAEMTALQGELQDCLAALRHLNAGHGFVWTANVSTLREYAAAYERRRRQRLPHAERAHMRPASAHETPHAELEASTTTTSYESGASVSLVMPQLNAETRRSTSSSGNATTATPRVSGCPAGSQVLLSLPSAKLPAAPVRESYAVFVQACGSLLDWLDAALALATHADDVPQAGTYVLPANPSPAPQAQAQTQTQSPAASAPTRTVRVRRYEVHDVRQLYESMAEQAHTLAGRDYTEFDRRLHRRLLQPASLYAVRDLIAELSAMIDQLGLVAARRLPASVLTIPDMAPYDSYAARTMTAHAVGVRAMGGNSNNGIATNNNSSVAAVHSSSSSNAREEDGATIVFRPPLSAFRALRGTLRLFLSVSLGESERSAWLSFRGEYDAVLHNAREVTRLLQDIPRPALFRDNNMNNSTNAADEAKKHKNIASEVAHSPAPATEQGNMTGSEPAELTMMQVEHYSTDNHTSEHANENGGGGGREAASLHAVQWSPSQEERARLYRHFEAYWALRERAKTLKDGLERDIKQKNKTHTTRVAAQAVREERDAFALKAEKWVRQLALRRAAQENNSSSGNVLWRTARASLQALTSLLTCRAELPGEAATSSAGNNTNNGDDEGMPGWRTRVETDEEGMALSAHSPLFAEKQRLLYEVRQLWKLIEFQGTQLEHSYPNLFHRSEKHRWLRQLDEFMRKANAITVVFD